MRTWGLCLALPALMLTAPNAAMAQDKSGPPQLISFDGVNLLARAASRQRILSQPLTFRLIVDAQGTATECETARDFRRTATEIDLCRPILKYSRFEPATDNMGNPITGEYEMTIDYNTLITERAYAGRRDRD